MKTGSLNISGSVLHYCFTPKLTHCLLVRDPDMRK
jgi:hypothetical protein